MLDCIGDIVGTQYQCQLPECGQICECSTQYKAQRDIRYDEVGTKSARQGNQI